jgi:hypothetical protein
VRATGLHHAEAPACRELSRGVHATPESCQPARRACNLRELRACQASMQLQEPKSLRGVHAAVQLKACQACMQPQKARMEDSGARLVVEHHAVDELAVVHGAA